MIRELIWDSTFFSRKIGELELTSCEPHHLKNVLDRAKQKGFKYVICKMTSQDTSLSKLLESAGFYLTDIGVIFAIEPGSFVSQNMKKWPPIRRSVRTAQPGDIAVLKRMATALFRDSRFYNDPFFSREDADRLYQSWVENSVKGEAADVVFCVPRIGFVTCRKSGRYSGEIVLIGIKRGFRGKGFGTALVGEAMRWFERERVKSVSVRTQLKNMKAVNFYVSLGFKLKKYDLVFGKIL
jgi:dTDP-4-amino-4,6-dideoxy-D-galactose acyltransferase